MNVGFYRPLRNKRDGRSAKRKRLESVSVTWCWLIGLRKFEIQVGLGRGGRPGRRLGLDHETQAEQEARQATTKEHRDPHLELLVVVTVSTPDFDRA